MQADGLQEVQTQLEDEAPATAGLAAAGPGHEAIWDVYNLCVVSFRESGAFLRRSIQGLLGDPSI